MLKKHIDGELVAVKTENFEVSANYRWRLTKNVSSLTESERLQVAEADALLGQVVEFFEEKFPNQAGSFTVDYDGLPAKDYRFTGLNGFK